PRQELLQRRYIDFLHPEDKTRTETEAARMQPGGQNNNFRNRHSRKDGSTVHLMCSSRYLAATKTLYAIARDISELVKVEQYQQAQQDILKMISTEQALPHILQRICLMAEQQSSVVRAAVMLKQDEQLQLAAAPSLHASFTAALNTL